MKRKVEDLQNGVNEEPSSKRKQVNGSSIESRFRADLFDKATLDKYTEGYANAQPYKHAVISSLIETNLLRAVREEIIANVSFTPKETDIYKIHQSGDLANLDGLDDSSLEKLPSLLALRDAMYSPKFREYVSHITGAGKLSGKKTDMAINVYTPGCQLLCHDDVIGSRRVSYILYLTNPDKPWKPEWGGALRLYPTTTRTSKDGDEIKTPSHAHCLSIPPAFGQLSFFVVQPGESYHDVEEVYHGETDAENEERTRMAISGWFHIPQEGEDGYEQGLEEQMAVRSSLNQLQSKNDEFDTPKQKLIQWGSASTTNGDSNGKGKAQATEEDDLELNEKDFDFLLKYISPAFLTPDMTEQLEAAFTLQSLLQLDQFLCDKFAARVKKYVEEQEASSKPSNWPIAEPPFKHRYCYLQPNDGPSDNPIQELVNELFPSQAFRKWLAMATGLDPSNLINQNLLARRFRRGEDYALASGFDPSVQQDGEVDDAASQPSNPEDSTALRIEFTLNITPTGGWEPPMDDEEEAEGEEDEGEESTNGKAGSKSKTNGHNAENEDKDEEDEEEEEFNSPGGEEVYMAPDDDEDEEEDDEDEEETADTDGKSNKKSVKSDPAVYKSAQMDDDDGILFSNPPSWNNFSIVLRDGGLRFVKYISRSAKGDRWDVKGEVGCWGVGMGFMDDDEEDDEDVDAAIAAAENDDDDDEDGWNGIEEKSDDSEESD